MDTNNVIFVDGVQAIDVHNGVVRLTMIRLGATCKPATNMEIMMPVPQVKAVVDA